MIYPADHVKYPRSKITGLTVLQFLCSIITRRFYHDLTCVKITVKARPGKTSRFSFTSIKVEQ